VYARAAGHADREAKTPVREDTVFRLASMTKAIVSVTALALVDRGKLSLDDPVTKWLPEFRPKLADGREPVITVRHLLLHTSGLGYTFGEALDGPYHKAEVSDGLAEPGLSAEVNLKRLASVPLLHEPGTKWKYSLSIDVLGEVVARAGGAPLPEVVKRLVTGPLGMTDTAFTADPARLAVPYDAGSPPTRMPEPYDRKRGDRVVRFSPARIFDAKSFPSGGAGMAGTARDYLAFIEAMRTGGAPILKPETARLAIEDQLAKAGVTMGDGEGFGYGFGVVLDPAAAKTRQGKDTFGWGGIYGTDFWVDPQARLSVVVLTNTAGEDALSGDDAMTAIYGPPPN
jgi:CubicO group peptidase (beta-lactamase class C family)